MLATIFPVIDQKSMACPELFPRGQDDCMDGWQARAFNGCSKIGTALCFGGNVNAKGKWRRDSGAFSLKIVRISAIPLIKAALEKSVKYAG